MILNLWFKLRDFFLFLFLRDPMKDLLNSVVNQVNILHKAELDKEQREREFLKIELKDKDQEIHRLNERIFNLLSPKEEVEVQINPEAYTPIIPDHSWNAKRTHLEDVHSRARREEILKKVAEREAEVELAKANES